MNSNFKRNRKVSISAADMDTIRSAAIDIVFHGFWAHKILPEMDKDLILFLNNGNITIGRYIGIDAWVDNNAMATEHYLSDSDISMWSYV